MNIFEQVALAWECLGATLRRIRHAALWAPWLVLGAAQLATVVLLACFAHPAASALMAPLVTALAGAGARHYPEVFRVLPDLHARAGFVVDALLGPVVAGAATVLFAASFARRAATPREAFAQALRRAGALVLAWLPFALVTGLLTFGLEGWLAGRGSAAITRRIGMFTALGGTLVLRAMMLYLIPMMMLGRMGPLAAWRELPHTGGRGAFTALTLVVLVTALTAPFAMLSRFVPRLVDGGTPEAVILVVAAQVAGALLSAFLLAGAAVLGWQNVEIETGEGW